MNKETLTSEGLVGSNAEMNMKKNILSEKAIQHEATEKVLKLRKQQLKELEEFRKRVGIPGICRIKGDPAPKEKESKCGTTETKQTAEPKRLTRSTAEEIKRIEEQQKKNQAHKEKQNINRPVFKNDEPGKSSTKGKHDGDILKPGKSSKKQKRMLRLKIIKTEEKEKKTDRKRKNTTDDDDVGRKSKKMKTVNSDSKHSGRSLRSWTVNSVDYPNTSNQYKTNSQFEEDGPRDEGFSCHICNKTFAHVDEFKDHKYICTKLKKKWTCPKCLKGFTQKTLLDQHYDYYYTSKPKQFICKLCNKDFPLKKSYLEHNRRLHNDADYKYVCDICGHGFFVKGEYTCHHVSHTKLKPYACGVCQKAAF